MKRLSKPPLYMIVLVGDKEYSVWFRDALDERDFTTPDGTVLTTNEMIPYWDVPRCFACEGPLEGGDVFACRIANRVGPLAWHLKCRPSDDEIEATKWMLT